MAIIIPNTSISLPEPSVTIGPAWASQLNAAISALAQLNHSFGQGLPVTPAGLLISTDLAFRSNSATGLLTAQFTEIAAGLTGTDYALRLFVSDGDIWYIDVNGTPIRITENGTLSATSLGGISGLPSGTASVGFLVDAYTFLKESTKYANMAVGPVQVFSGSDVSPAYGITLKTPDGIAASYDMTLPAAVPAVKAFVTQEVTGALSTDVSTVGGITNDMLAQPNLNSVTTTSFSVDTSNTSFQLVTGSTLALTTTGKSVLITLQPLAAGGGTISSATSGFGIGQFQLSIDGVAQTLASCDAQSKQSNCLGGIFRPAAGLHSITLEARVNISGGATTATFGACVMTAVEL